MVGVIREKQFLELHLTGFDEPICNSSGVLLGPGRPDSAGCGFAFDPQDAEEVEDAKRHTAERLKETGDPDLIEEALEALVEEKVNDALSD